MASSTAPPAPFNPAAEDWESYTDRFLMFLESSNLKGANGQTKRAVFLTHCGPAVFKMAKALAKPDDVKEMNWTDLEPLLRKHYAPDVPTLIRRLDFYRRDQKEGESISDFTAALRDLGGMCGFTDMDEAMRDRVVLGLRDPVLQSRLMAKGDITLAEALAEATAAEATRKSAARMRQANAKEQPTATEATPAANKHGDNSHRPSTTTHHGDIDSLSDSEDEEEEVHRLQAARERRERKEHKPRFQCAGCGGDHPRSDCRFLDAICRHCDKRGHIAKVCRNRRNFSPRRRESSPRRRDGTPPRTRDRFTESRWSRESRNKRLSEARQREETHQTVIIGHSSTIDARKVHVEVRIENQPCKMEVDSGSYLSMVSWRTLKRLVPTIRRRELQNQQLTLKDYQGNCIPVVGIGHFKIKFKGHTKVLPLTIVDRDRPSLLGLQWFAPLGIEVTGIHHTEEADWEATLVRDFQEVFNNDLGKYQGAPISFNLDPTIAPIRLKPRRVPFALKPKIDEQLDKLIAQGVLEPIDHARWETPIVTPIKPDGSLRICGDYKATLNHALQQSAYPVPVVQHLLHSLGGGRVFAKLDLAQAYQQLPVDEQTAEAQTIVTHRGAFRCNRLQFGVSVAPGVFQSLMERLLQGIKGVVPYFDDVLVAAENKKQLETRLREVLKKFKEAGLKVKKEKCQLCTERVEFLGYLLDKHGIHPTEKKLRAIKEAPTPKNKTELQAFLGLINFYNVFLPQKATAAEPLHRLLDKTATWTWGKREENAFQRTKDLLTSDAVLIQYSETLPLRVTCDASPFGVGAILSHTLPDNREAPIAFFSRTLSKPERNYSQLDKEALAIISGVKRFHEYLYGRTFSIVTDHKPLLGILAGDKATPNILSPRMTRWSEFLAAYTYQLTHRPGKNISHADALSRSPLPDLEDDPAPTTTTLQIETLPNPPLTAPDIARETNKDKRLARVLGWVEKGWPVNDNDEQFKPFRSRQTELFTQKGCILWGDRVVIPDSLQKGVLEMLHEGHPGMVKMKSLSRSYAWWPGMDKQIETWVASCDRCQQTRPNPPTAPVRDWETPRGPWSRIHIDFAGPTKGHTFLITVDAYSNWLEVSTMKTTTTEAVIGKLNKLFSTHGLPDVIVSDNGPQFTSLTFEKFLAERGIRHALTAPAHPAANGRAERMVQYTKNTIQKIETGDIQEKINKMLLIQHITPNTTTNKSPAELLMGRKLRSPLDRLHPTYNPEKPPDSSSKYRTFKIGDPVYAKNFMGDPLWIPAQITQTTGPRSYRLQTSDGRSWKRHIDQLRSRINTDRNQTDNNEAKGGRENPKETQEEQNPTRINQPYLPEINEERLGYSPGNSSQASSTSPERPGRSRRNSRSTSPENPGGSGQSRPGSPDTPIQTVPSTPAGEAERPTEPVNNEETTKTRKSTRQVRSPAYLRDYVTTLRRTKPRGEGCSVLTYSKS